MLHQEQQPNNFSSEQYRRNNTNDNDNSSRAITTDSSYFAEEEEELEESLDVTVSLLMQVNSLERKFCLLMYSFVLEARACKRCEENT